MIRVGISLMVTALNPRTFVLVINIFFLVFDYIANIRVFFDICKFSDICLKLLTMINISVR